MHIAIQWLYVNLFKTLVRESILKYSYGIYQLSGVSGVSGSKLFNISHLFSAAEKMKFPADLVTFPEEILNGKLHFLCSVP